MSLQDKIVIALDCMGGDNAPLCVIEGIDYLDDDTKKNLFFLLYGDEFKIGKCLNKHPKVRAVSKVMHTSAFIGGNDKPTIALKRRDTSMRMAIDAVKNGEAQAIISAGNTGALMAISKMVLRTIHGIDRPALIQLIPNFYGNSTALLDMGANINCDSINLYQFALMGSAFYRAVNDCENPKIGILNVGSEDMKGSDSVKNAAAMLRQSYLADNYFGYIEGDDIMKGVVDVVVTDGFVGNVALKTIEGSGKFCNNLIREIFSDGIFSKIAFLFARRSIHRAKAKIDYKQRNGAMLIGLNGVVVKSHGNSDKISYSFAIKNTVNLIKNKINEEIISSLQNSDFDDNDDTN